jgi:hypothetical protein
VKLRRSARRKDAQSPPPSESSESPSASGEEERTGNQSDRVEDAWSGFVGDDADTAIHLSDDGNDEEDAHGEPDLEYSGERPRISMVSQAGLQGSVSPQHTDTQSDADHDPNRGSDDGDGPIDRQVGDLR